jgi:molecular chaperone DnaK (HSP70)
VEEKAIYQRHWTRVEFADLIRPILQKTVAPCMAALQDAKIQASDLSDVILVGGPTRLAEVQELVSAIFGRSPNTSMHPDEVVAEGAAIQADILAGHNQDLLLLDVVPLSLGLETYGGVMSPLIARNTKIPAVAKEVFTTFVDHQNAVDIHILQGEREKVSDNRSLARFKLGPICPAPAGIPRIEVSFLVDADGILQVGAKDVKTGLEQFVEVRPSYGLTDQQVEQMLQNQEKNRERDLEYHRLVTVRNEAEPVLRATEKQLNEAARLLPKEEIERIQHEAQCLREALVGENIQAIQDAHYRLSQITIPMAERLLQERLDGR